MPMPPYRALAQQLKDLELEVRVRTDLATVLDGLEKTEEARKEFDTILARMTPLAPPLRANVLGRFALHFIFSQRYAEAKTQLTQAQALLKGPETVALELALSSMLARVLIRQKQFERAFPLLHAARKKAQERGILRYETKLALLQADFYDDLDQHQSTVKTAEEALALAQKSGSRWDTALGHTILSYGLYGQDKYAEASQAARRALTIVEKLGPHSYQVRALLSLATSQFQLKEYDPARQNIERALAAAPTEREARYSLYQLLAAIQQQQGHPDQARATLRKHLAEDPSPTNQARLLAQLAGSFYAEKNFTEALAVTDEMERQAKTLKLPSLEAQALRVRAGALDAQGKPDAALAALEKALVLFRDQKDSENEGETLLPSISRQSATPLLRTPRGSARVSTKRQGILYRAAAPC